MGPGLRAASQAASHETEVKVIIIPQPLAVAKIQRASSKKKVRETKVPSFLSTPNSWQDTANLLFYLHFPKGPCGQPTKKKVKKLTSFKHIFPATK